MRKLFSGATLIGLSLLMALGFLKADIKEGPLVKALTFSLVVVLPLGGGLGLIHSHQRDRHNHHNSLNQRTLNTLKSAILSLAQQYQGKLTPVEVIRDLGISPDQTQQALDGLLHDQLADLEVTESGILVYVFPEIQALPEKAGSKSILDI